MTLRLNGSTSGYTEIDAPAVAGNNTLILPGGNGSANQRLVTDGSGTLSWSSDVMLAAGSAASPSLYFSGDTNTGMWSPSADALAWSTGGTERMRIGSDGRVYINRTTTIDGNQAGILQISADSTTKVASFYQNAAGAGSSSALTVGRATDGAVIEFYRATTQVGSISITTTNTAYNTSSDYRLKENVTAVTDGITRLQQLKPSRFNFIANPGQTVDGFIAHEVQSVVPEAITGEKDAVDADGNPIYQGIDQSKLVPLLTAALQEAVAKIESLETRIAALEVTP